MDSFKIDGKEYDFLFSLRAIGEYQTLLLEAKDKDKVTSSVNELETWIYLGLKYGAKDRGLELEIDRQFISNWMEHNFEDALKIGNECRKKFQRFALALSGRDMDEEENGQAKKKPVKQ